MIDKAYLLYLFLMAVFGFLCYRFGYVCGKIDQLEEFIDWCMGMDLSEDDPVSEEADR